MIITAMAMYLNTVEGSSFSYLITFIGDMVLISLISSEHIVKNYITKDKEK